MSARLSARVRVSARVRMGARMSEDACECVVSDGDSRYMLWLMVCVWYVMV